jgi:hypothetical protein
MRRVFACLPVILVFTQTAPYAPTRAHSSEPRAAAEDRSALPNKAEMERLARTRPVEFLEQCLRYYERNVQGYTTVMRKQERLEGKLQRSEVIEVAFRERPFSVRMHWLEGARLANAVLYVQGENGGNMLVQPALALARGFIVQRDPEGAEARQSGRYPVKDFGIRKGMERTLASWKAAHEKGELHVECLGEVHLKEAGDRTCLALRRTQYARPEMDGVIDLTVYLDEENWLQIGSVVKGEEGKLIGAYYFRDVQINPDFKAGQFTRDGLKP